MPKNANMDELHNCLLSGVSSSPTKEPPLKHGDEFVSGGGEPVVQKSVTTKSQQISLSEASVRECDCDSVDNLKILDGSSMNSSFESLTAHDLGSENIEPLEQKQDVAQDIGRKSPSETGVVASSELPGPEYLEHSNGEQIVISNKDPISNSIPGDFRLPHENGAAICAPENMGSATCAPENMGSATCDAHENHLDLQHSEPAEKDATNVASESVPHEGTSLPSRKQISSLLPPVSNRVLRSRSQEKPKASESKAVEVENSANEGRKSKQRKGRMKKIPVNEFSRIRTHLRYLLHRVKYERNLIDAYSCEGWKGQRYFLPYEVGASIILISRC